MTDDMLVDRAWRRITTFFAERAPDAPPFPPPASEAQVLAWEARLGRRLPDGYRRWLLSSSGGSLVRLGTWESLSPESALAEQSAMLELHAAGISSAWDPSWAPFASDGAGSSLCFDEAGAVWLYPRAAAAHDVSLEAASFAEWLQAIAGALEAGALVVTEDASGRYRSVVSRAFAEQHGLLLRGEPREVRAKKLARRPAPQAIAGYLFRHLDRWHLVAPPIDPSIGGMVISMELARESAEHPVARIRAVLRSHDREIVVSDEELQRAWSVLAEGRSPGELPRPPEGRQSAFSFAHRVYDEVDGRGGPDVLPRLAALEDALDAHEGARRAWTLPATWPLPDDVVDDLAAVVREHLALERSLDELRDAILRSLGGAPDPRLADRVPL